MRIAALYDIHANLPALEAVVADAREAGADRLVIGGDVVPGPMPVETLAYLASLDIPFECIRGNGESAVLAYVTNTNLEAVPAPAREAAQWNAEQLDAEHARVLASWPATLQVDVPGLGRVLFCHATPRNDTDIFTRLTPEPALLPIFDGVTASLVICGHTHMQFDRTIGGRRVVNAGSVGMPFAAPGAYWLLLDTEVRLRHTAFDLAGAAARIRASTYPQAEDFATRNVLHPPSEQAMVELFTSVGVH